MHAERKLWKRKWVWKAAAALGVGLIIVITAIALAPSDDVWIEASRALEARGEVLDWEKIIPPKVPPEENMFEHPAAASLLPMKGQKPAPDPLGIGSPRPSPGSVQLGMPFAMANLRLLPREANATNQLSLAGLHDWFAQWDEPLAQLRQAAKRPHARFPGDYTSPLDVPFHDFVAARQLAQVLASRAKVHLLLGDSAAAFEDLEAISAVMKSCKAKPGTLVISMIHVAIAGLYLDTIEEGFHENLWAEREMFQIIPRLREMNLLAVAKEGIRSERVYVLRILEAVANRKRDPIYTRSVNGLAFDDWSLERFLFRFSPPTWIRRDQARYAQLIQGYLDGFDSSARRFDQQQLNLAEQELARLKSGWWAKSVLVRYLTPNFSKAAATVARNQAEADRIALVLALELFRSRRGSYPSSLQQLVPEFIESLPLDLHTGKDVEYELLPSGYKVAANNAQFSQPTNTARLGSPRR